MQSIKHVLRERWYAWEDAQRMYKQGARPEYESYMEETAEVEEKPTKA